MRLCSPCILITAAVLAACSTFGRGDVQREWNNTFRELGILPIYPPREDVQVGDIYVRKGNPADTEGAYRAGFPPIDLLFARADLGVEVGNHYAARADFPTTPADWASSIAKVPTKNGGGTAPASAGGGGAQAADAAAARAAAGMFVQGDVQRLRQVAFPEFSTITLTSGDLSGVLPIKALSLAFAASRSSISKVRLKVPNGESYSLPAAGILAKVASNGVLKPDLFPPAVLQALHAQAKEWAKTAPGLGCEARWRLQNDRYVYLDLVNEVYYTRTFEVSVDRAIDAGVALDIRTIDAAAAQTRSGQTQGAQSPQGTAGQEPPRQDPLQRANALNQRLRESVADNQGAPRGALSFTSVSEAHVGLVQTYEHPIAIGMRSMTIAVDPADGRIVGAMAGGGPNPAVTTSGYDYLVQAMRQELGATASIVDDSIELTAVADATREWPATLSPELRSRIARAAKELAENANQLDRATETEISRFAGREWRLVIRR